MKNKNHNTKHLGTNTMRNFKSFKEYFTGQINANKEYDLKDKALYYKLVRQAMSVMPGSEKQKQIKKEIERVQKRLGIKEYVGGSIGGQRGPGLGNFRPMASMKKQEGTALHGYLIKAGILKK